jgi:hypothetical protein
MYETVILIIQKWYSFKVTVMRPACLVHLSCEHQQELCIVTYIYKTNTADINIGLFVARSL